MNYGKEFQKYAMSDHKISSLEMDQYGELVKGSMTPYILEEREMRATQLDIFSRLMMDRIIWVSSDVNSKMASIIQAQLMFLDTTDTQDINLYLDTPGGSVLSGLGIRDTMNYVKSDISTTNVGMCASMGSILLSWIGLIVGVACDGMTDVRSDGMLSHPAIMIDASNTTINKL